MLIVGILTFMSRINFSLSWVEHEKSFITLSPGCVFEQVTLFANNTGQCPGSGGSNPAWLKSVKGPDIKPQQTKGGYIKLFRRPFNPSERPAHTPNKKKKWQEPQLYGSNKINDKVGVTVVPLYVPPHGKTICLGENKGAGQLRGNREADQRLCFCYSDSTIPLLLKSEISSF